MSLGTRTGESTLITDEAVRALIDEQFPHLVDEEIGRRYTLEDHIAVRIGDHHGALFPRFAVDDGLFARVADLVRPHMERWSFPVSAPVGTGVPGAGYPHHWTLVEWISASTAAFVPLHAQSARALGAAIREIHVPAPADAPSSDTCAGGLAAAVPEWERLVTFAALRGAPENRVLDAQATDALFHAGVAAPVDVMLTWTHGRLEPRAIQSDRGTFCGILIWQHFGVGDRAVDLGTAAVSLPEQMRDELHAGYGALSPATVLRARSYMLLAALRYIELDDPFMARMAWERLIELDLVHEA